MFSMNGATQSFGLAAAVGEVATVLAALLLLPAISFWMVSRKGQGESGTRRVTQLKSQLRSVERLTPCASFGLG
jgi:hypothetical protein